MALYVFLCLGCTKESVSTYSFIIKNSTQKNIKLNFSEELNYGNYIVNKDEVILLPSESKIIRTFQFGFGRPFEISEIKFYDFFKELKFDTYIDSIKLEKELWSFENWGYKLKSKKDNYAEYEMTITDDMIAE